MKDDYVQACPTVIGPDLDWHHLIDTIDVQNSTGIVFRQTTACGAESIFLKHNQGSFRVRTMREIL